MELAVYFEDAEPQVAEGRTLGEAVIRVVDKIHGRPTGITTCQAKNRGRQILAMARVNGTKFYANGRTDVHAMILAALLAAEHATGQEITPCA